MTGARVSLLVDSAVLDGHAASLPLAWLDALTLVPFAPRDLTPHTPGAMAAQALLVRTVTRVDAALLAGLPNLTQLATLSSGTDHLDVDALARRGVGLHTGHTGNALAVADWVAWALTRLRSHVHGTRVLVVGVGAVGTQVAARLTRLGWTPVLCDPPRAAREPGFPTTTLDEALDDGPYAAVTLHVPKVVDGPHATTNLLNAERLRRLAGAAVLNAARGGVLDEQAAVALRQSGHLTGLCVDTFVGEPAPLRSLLATADLVTPHIGGHSIEGKLRVAHLAVAGLRRALGVAPPGAWESAARDIVRSLAPRPLDAQTQLDAAAVALKSQPDAFEAIRHAHKRVEDNLP